MSDIDLREVLHRASETQDAPELVGRALVAARARRVRRRGGTAAAVAAVLVAGIVLVPRVEGWPPGSVGTPATETSPTPVPTPTPTPTPTLEPDPPPVAPDPDPATQPLWDPQGIAAAPLRATRLPERIDLQTIRATPATPLSARPMSGVVAALLDGTDLLLLDTDGSWRSVTVAAYPGAMPVGANVQQPAISADGGRVAVPVDAGILVVDAVSGAERTVPWPEALAPPRDGPPTVLWQPGEDGFIAFDGGGTWLVGLDGTSREAPYRSYALGVDPAGPVYQNDFERSTLVTFDGDEAVEEAPFPQCERMVAAYGLVACTAGSLEPFRSGPVVVDPETGEIVAYAPVKDRLAVYSDQGHLTLMGFLDESTLLMAVGPGTSDASGAGRTTHLASWQFRTGEVQRISTDVSGLGSLTFAPSLVDRK